MEKYRAEDRTGGPAFPTKLENYNAGFGGMTLRDWFAGQVISGYVFKTDRYGTMAQEAYIVADAMMKARME